MTDVSAVTNRNVGKPAQAAGKGQGGEGKGDGASPIEGAFATLFSLIGGVVDPRSAEGEAKTGNGKGEGVSFAALAAGLVAGGGEGDAAGVEGAATGGGEAPAGLTLAVDADAAAKIALANQRLSGKAARTKAEEAAAQLEALKAGKPAENAEDIAVEAEVAQTEGKDGKAETVKADAATADQPADNASALAILATVLHHDIAPAATTTLPATGESKGRSADLSAAKVGDGATAATGEALAQQAQADASGGNADASAQDQGDRAESPFGLALGKKPSGESGAPKLAASPLHDVVDALPQGIQAQLGTQPPLGTDTPAMTVQGPSSADALSDQVIDMGVSGQWIDRMAREIATLADGTGHSRFQLNPPNLGRVQVDLWQGDNATHLRMMTETDEAARRLREGQGALEANARVAALSLGSVTVEKASAPFDSGHDQGSNPNPRQQADFGGQPQQQAGNQAQGESGFGRSALNRGAFQAVMGGNERQAEPAPVRSAASGTDGRRVRFA